MKYFTFLALLMLLNAALCSELVERHDGEEISEHDHEGVDGFDLLVNETGSPIEGKLNNGSIQEILDRLNEPCLSVDSIFTILDLQNADGLTEDEFARAAYLIASAMLQKYEEGSCPGMNSSVESARNLIVSAGEFCRSNISSLIERFIENEKFVPSNDNQECFGSATILSRCTTDQEEINEAVMNLVISMARGLCLLPEPQYFENELLELFNANEEASLSKQDFEELLENLNIGEVREADDGHGHEGEHGHEDEHGHEEGHEGEHGHEEGHDDDDEHGHEEGHDDDEDENGHEEGDDDGDEHGHEEGHNDDEDEHGHEEGNDDDDEHGHEEGHDDDEDENGHEEGHDDEDENGHEEGDDDGDEHGHEEGHNDDEDEHGHEEGDDGEDEHDDEEDHGHEEDHSGEDTHGDEEDEHHDDDDHDGHMNKTNANEHEEEHTAIKRCYSPSQLLTIAGNEKDAMGNMILTKEGLVRICPALLQQRVSNACVEEHVDTPPAVNESYTQAKKYGFGTLACLIISFLAFGGLLLFPSVGSPSYKLTMQFFIALGVGALSGDALLHLIPEVVGLHAHGAGDSHDHDEEEEDKTYLFKLLVVIVGIYLFYFFENVLRLYSHIKKKNISLNQHHHTNRKHSHATPGKDAATNHVMTRFGIGSPGNDAENSTTDLPEGNGVTKPHLESDVEKEAKPNTVCCGVTSVGIMVFIGDALHNIGDGLAIGVAFSTSLSAGIGTSIAIFCHELPHEFGDFAIYLKNGASKWQALGMNFLAACSQFIGLYIGLSVGENEDARQWMLALIAGMFLYISLVNVLHELVEEVLDNRPILIFVLQNLGLCIGWVILLVLSLYEDKLRNY